MYYCFTEFHPFWLEVIKLKVGKKKRWQKRGGLRWRFGKLDESRHGDYATTKLSLMIQINSYYINFLWHWNPVPEWSLEVLERCRRAG